MMVIPQEEYLQLTSAQQTREPLLRQFYNLQNQYNQQAHIDDPYSKLMHQSETLDAIKTLKDKMRQEIVMATPKPFQSRARSLFQHLEPVLKINERGEIFNHDDEVIPQSRIEDLIQYAVRDRRRHFLPVGWDSFLNTLREHNIPKFMLNRDTLEEMEHVLLPPVREHKPVKKVINAVKEEIKSEIFTPPRRKRPRLVLNKGNDDSKAKRKSTTPIKQRLRRKPRQTEKFVLDFLKRY